METNKIRILNYILLFFHQRKRKNQRKRKKIHRIHLMMKNIDRTYLVRRNGTHQVHLLNASLSNCVSLNMIKLNCSCYRLVIIFMILATILIEPEGQNISACYIFPFQIVLEYQSQYTQKQTSYLRYRWRIPFILGVCGIVRITNIYIFL